MAAVTDVVQHQRHLVRESWQRALGSGLDPHRTSVSPHRDLNQFRDERGQHPLETLMPVVRDLLVEPCADAGLIVAIADNRGQLLRVEGDTSVRTAAEDIGFAEGATWSEQTVGTNAPGTALATGAAVQIFGAEHFADTVKHLSCTAVPVRDAAGTLVGAIDVTGDERAVALHSLALVRATAAAVSAELRLRARAETARAAQSTGVSAARGTLTTLATHRPLLNGRPISLRHAEILVTLAHSRVGLSTEALIAAIFEDEVSPVTLRAELARLRKLLAAETTLSLSSRPYVLSGPLDVDALRVLELLDRGSHRQALAAYRGPILPTSSSPAVVKLRDHVQARVRETMLTHASADVLTRYAHMPEAEYDQQVWETLLMLLPARSPRRTAIVTHIERIQS